VSAAARRRLAAGLLCWAALAACGCNTVSSDAQRRSLAALATTTPRPGAGLGLGAPTARCLQSRHRYDSLAPAALPLPRPGHMPAGTFMHTLQERGTFFVGVDQNSLGLGYFNPNTNHMEGLDIDLVEQIARAIFGGTGATRAIRYVALSTAQRASAIWHKKVDMVASAFSVTCARRNRMLFSSVYHVARQRLLVPERSKVSGLRDLRGKRVCATKQSTSLARLEHSSAATGVIPHPVELRTDCLVALQEGRVAAVTSDDAILLGFKRQDPQTKIVGSPLGCEHYGIAINNDHPEFVRFVNAVLKRLRRSRYLQAITQRWLRPAATRTHYKDCTAGGR
jgi:polar amino acid transport system substrate-binding protein